MMMDQNPLTPFLKNYANQKDTRPPEIQTINIPWEEFDEDSSEIISDGTFDDDISQKIVLPQFMNQSPCFNMEEVIDHPPSDNDAPQVTIQIPATPSISQSCSNKRTFFTLDDVSPLKWREKNARSYIVVYTRTLKTQCYS